MTARRDGTRRPRRGGGRDGSLGLDRRFRIGIVGGGASGTLLATRLLSAAGSGVEVVVIEPRPVLGQGVAYGTDDPWHRLNVPACAISALPEDPDQFQRWAGVQPGAFVPRRKYAAYLADLLANARASSPARLDHVRSAATSITPTVEGLAIAVASGPALVVDAAVLATGVGSPSLPDFLAALGDDPRLVRNPWVPRALDRVRDGDAVAVVGTGLTGIDVAGSVLARHGSTSVVAISRHGLLPRRHEDPWRPRLPEPIFGVDLLETSDDPLAEAAALLRARGRDWRRAVDSLRPITQQLWLAMDAPTRARFLRDYRDAWDVARHRMPAEVGRVLDAWVAAGRLSIERATIERVTSTDGRLRLETAVRPDGTRRAWEADRIVAATGPDPDAATNPLVASLIEAGLARPGPQGIAIDIAPATGRVLGRREELRLPLFALGPLRRGVVWESIAMPEIRDQAARLATHLLQRVPA